MRPDRHRQTGDRDGGRDEAGVAEHRLAAEHRDHLRDDAEERQRQDVDLGMAEEPEQVLPEHRTARGRVEDVRAELAVALQRQQRGGQHREDQQHQERGEQHVPAEDGHPEHGQAGGPHADDRGDEVDGAEDRAEAGERHAHDPHIGADAGRMDRVGQRRVEEPAEVGGALRGGEAGGRDQRAEHEQPEGQHVQPGEGDVGGADLQRHDPVGEAGEQRHREEQQHHRTVHGERLVELLVGEDLRPRPGELGAHDQGEDAADQEEPERGHQVHGADRLVVGGRQQPDQGRAGPSGPDLSRSGGGRRRRRAVALCLDGAQGRTPSKLLRMGGDP